jgi:hypothetical protein
MVAGVSPARPISWATLPVLGIQAIFSSFPAGILGLRRE